MSASYRASGVKGDPAQQRPRDLAGNLAEHDQRAKALAADLRAEIARLERDNHRLQAELSFAWRTARQPLPEGSIRNPRTPASTAPFKLPGWPSGLPSQRRRPA